MGCFVLGWQPEKFVLLAVWSKYIFLRKWFRNNFLKIEASVGLPQRRSVPRKDQSAERGGCRKESNAEIAVKMY